MISSCTHISKSYNLFQLVCDNKAFTYQCLSITFAAGILLRLSSLTPTVHHMVFHFTKKMVMRLIKFDTS